MFTLVQYKPHYHCTNLSATRHAVTGEKEGFLVIHYQFLSWTKWMNKLVFCHVLVLFATQKQTNDPVVFATAAPIIIPLGIGLNCFLALYIICCPCYHGVLFKLCKNKNKKYTQKANNLKAQLSAHIVLTCIFEDTQYTQLKQ